MSLVLTVLDEVAELHPTQVQMLGSIDLFQNTSERKLAAVKRLGIIDPAMLNDWTHRVRGLGINEHLELNSFGLNVLSLCGFAFRLEAFVTVR